MKRFSLLLIMLLLLFAQTLFSQYSVQITKEFWSWQINGNELEGNLVAKLFLNGQALDTTDFVCTWYRNWNGPWEFYRNGFKAGRHGITAGAGYDVKAVVTQPGNPPFSVESQQYISAPPASQRDIFLLHSKLENQQPAFGNTIFFWAYPDWHEGKLVTVAADPEGRYFTNNDAIALRTVPNFRSDNQKFSIWVDDNLSKYYTNHQQVEMDPAINLFTSQYRTSTDNISIVVTLNGSSTTAAVEFLDPWSQDYPDPSYGYTVRNRGISAPFSPLTSGNNNLGFSTTHQGVFLNQEVASGVFYSVKASLIATINGAAAFFTGWNYDPNYIALQQVGSNPPGYDQKAVIFKQAGAVLTAQYTNSTISQNTTIPAGTFPMAGSLTVSSGVTLTLNPGTTLEFPSGATLTANGKITATGTSGQKVTFTRRSGSSDWYGISFSGSGASGSSLQQCVISFAKQPLVASNAGSLTISNTRVDNSTFYDMNPNDAAALRFYNSSPTITYVTITGGTVSWNGVRFAQGSTGSITSSTIQNCGQGNGIVVQGGSSPRIQSNTIQNNFYHGIIIVSNGSASPIIISNVLVGNGNTTGSPLYNGINFYQSTGKVGSNTVQQSNMGLYCDTYSSPTSWWTGSYWGFGGNNTLSNNYRGLSARSYSNPSIGHVEMFHGEPVYYGACNNILNNNNANAAASVYSWIEAAGNWWGQAPPDPSKMIYDGTSWIAYGYWGTPTQQCPGGGGGASIADLEGPRMSIVGDGSITETDPVSARIKGDYAASRELYLAMLESESTLEQDKIRALVGLYEVFRDSRDQLSFQGIAGFKTDRRFGSLATELLMNSHVIAGDYDRAASLAQERSKSLNSTEAVRALMVLASLDAFSNDYRDISTKARNDIRSTYASALDEGLLVALGIEPTAAKASGEGSLADGEILFVSNYPNPFNPSTIISFTIPHDGHVLLKIYDMLGRLVHTLIDEVRPAGSYKTNFDGSRLPSGVYIYRLAFEGATLSKKFVLAK